MYAPDSVPARRRLNKLETTLMASTAYGPPLKDEARRFARIRFHQAWYRVHILGISSYGTTPRGRELGSVLTVQDGDTGVNFTSRSALALYRSRRAAGWGVEPVRCERHMTSSQTLTINVAALFQEAPEETIQLLVQATGRRDWVSIASIDLEYAPPRPSLHLGDKSRIDLLISVKTRTGSELVALEIKYMDRFNSRAVNLRTEPYREIMKSSGVWNENMDLEPRSLTNQLLRCHALATSVSRAEFNQTKTTFILLTLREDHAANSIADMYRRGLSEPERFIHLHWEDFLGTFQSVATKKGTRDTAERLQRRYVRWEDSESVWQSFTAESHEEIVDSPSLEAMPQSVARAERQGTAAYRGAHWPFIAS